MEFKENAEAAMMRMDAWWDHEITDRVVMPFEHTRIDVPIMPFNRDTWILAKEYDAIEKALDEYEHVVKTIHYGGELFPRYHPNYGPGIMATVLGVEPEFRSQTTWFLPKYGRKDFQVVVDALEDAKMNDTNEWYVRLLRITDYAAKRGKGRYTVAVTDLGGILDILASFLKPVDLFYAMRKKPDFIDTCRAIIMEKWLKVYNDLQSTIESHGHGCNSWLNIWCRKRWYPLQCDVAYGISPAMFTRFVLPDLVEQAENMDYAIYHLDGVEQLPFLDDLLATEAITGIQWVPGDGRPGCGSEAWLPVHRKIQAAGKNTVINVSPQNLNNVLAQLDPRGLYPACGFGAKIWADYYLPVSMGGMGGIDDEDEREGGEEEGDEW
ncbi:MAG: hypothetical protein ACTSUE_25920 [Promethearchaeota archaeon]